MKSFRKAGIDALLVSGPHNVRYLSGFTGEDSALLVSRRRSVLITDGRFTTQAAQEVGRSPGCGIITRRKGMMETVAETARRLGVKRLGVESAAVTLAEFRRLERLARPFSLVETAELVEKRRLVKGADEVAMIEAAVKVAEAAFRRCGLWSGRGSPKRKLAAALEEAISEQGGDGVAVPLIVLSGERAALPHGHPTDRQVRVGEPVLFDWRPVVKGYVSDLTRVLFVHRMSPHQRHLYESVLDSQACALRRIRPGMVAGKLDEVARKRLAKSRLGRFFTHGLGHGVGLQVHEAPRISAGSGERLRAGMVFTVEPGAYQPGRIGIRIEDMALVTSSGCRVLSSLPKKPDDVIVRS